MAHETSKDKFARIDIGEEYVYGILDADETVRALSRAPWLNAEETGRSFAKGSYRLLAPCVPSKIVAIGRNYIDHAAEFGSQVPKEPLMFLKPPSSLLDLFGEIKRPPVELTQRIDYEGELAIVIGKRCSKSTAAAALEHVFGYTIANDVTARDLQKKDGQWTRAKSFDTFCPLGPWIVRELQNAARLKTFVNDGEKPIQDGAIAEMVFGPAQLIAAISAVMTLEPGDVILTGTPAGVGAINPGDRVRVEIDGIGSLENTLVA
jgi:2-keto-4-pentenoate hydratase/2-oxohepta-3-ene-1,7-dioic acid hydratase in catechol pathway